MQRRLVLLAFLLQVLLALASPAMADKEPGQPVKIGVLANRGKEMALAMWTPTADSLSQAIPPTAFTVVPLGFHEINAAVGSGEVDFVIANPSIYIELEELFATNRIATMKNRGPSGPLASFGGVIFRKNSRTDLARLADLKGKKFLAVDETSLGGWQVAWREFKANGIDPYRDFSSLRFADTHDAVVYAVRDGEVDAGTVRTDTLERMAQEGKITLDEFHVLNQQQNSSFPFLLSTRLYPEWPLAKVRHTPDELAERVVATLLVMEHDTPANKAARIQGWTVPGGYQHVRDLMRELHLGPYRDYGKVSLAMAIRQHWRWVALLLFSLVILAGATIAVSRMNRRLAHSRALLEEERSNLEHNVQARTAELRATNEELLREVAERKRAEATIRQSEKKIKDIAAALGEGLYVLDADGVITFVNPEAGRLLGLSEAELLGRHIHDVVHDRDDNAATHPVEHCPLLRASQTGNRFFSRDELFRRTDGTPFPVSINCMPFFEHGSAVASVTTFRDISNSKQLESEREALIASLQKALAEIKTLHGFIPICSCCKKIRDDKGAWHQIEAYISQRTDAQFSHGVCMECAQKLYPDLGLEPDTG